MNTTKAVTMKEAYGEGFARLVEFAKTTRYYKEIKSLLRTLAKHGFDPVEVDDGEEYILTPTQVEAAVAIANVDEARLYVKKRSTGKELGLYLVLGNDPGELVCDYHVDNDLDEATDEHYERWSR